MEQVRIAQLKARLSHYVRLAERGERIEILDRNRPIARLVPLDDEADDLELTLPLIPFESVRDKQYEPADWADAAEEMLMEDRRRR